MLSPQLFFSRRTSLFALVAFLLGLAPSVDAQIYAVHFKSEKIAKRYKKHTTIIDGEAVFVGEAVEGGGVRLVDGVINYRGGGGSGQSDSSNLFFRFDHKDPSWVPYKFMDGEKEKKKKSTVNIGGADIERLRILMRTEDISTIAKEFSFRRARIDERIAARKAEEKGSRPWMVQHDRMIGEYERLLSWMENLPFADAIKKLEKELAKQKKAVRGEAAAARAKRAEKSIKKTDTPEDLIEASKDITNGTVTMHVRESQHVRIVYMYEFQGEATIPDEQIEASLLFAERVIDGFKVEFVDPYLDEEFEDRIPDDLFTEFWFGPNDVGMHDRFLTDYYGLNWGKNKARRFESRGNRFLQSVGPIFLEYWRWEPNEDIEGILAHSLGHELADLHFNNGPHGMNQDWMEEGLGYYLSFEFRGRNSVTCKAFSESNYVKKAGKEGKKTVMIGLRDIYNKSALEKGPRLDRLAIKPLYDMEDPDLAKSWSLFDFIAKDMGKDGQVWLRAACKYSRKKNSFIADWRAFSNELFGVEGKDVFKVMDDRWRAFASGQQDTSEKRRSKKKGR